MNVQLGFDAASLATLSRLTEFDVWLAATFAEAMPEALDELEQASQAIMLDSFINNGGVAVTAFEQHVSSPWQAELTNTAPYGRRLNYGFSGMTDSLGRYYPYWPAYHWAERGMDLAAPAVEGIFSTAVQTAIDEVSA